MQAYSDPSRENDPYALPDLEIFQLTAEEAVSQLLDEDQWVEYRKEFPSSLFNSRDSDKLVQTIIEREGIEGGWFYWYCFPGCLPDSEAMGPFPTRNEALAAARDDADMPS